MSRRHPPRQLTRPVTAFPDQTAAIKDHCFSYLGLSAAACVACCIGPVLCLFAFLGGLSLAAAVSSRWIGSAGLLVAGAAAHGIPPGATPAAGLPVTSRPVNPCPKPDPSGTVARRLIHILNLTAVASQVRIPGTRLPRFDRQLSGARRGGLLLTR